MFYFTSKTMMWAKFGTHSSLLNNYDGGLFVKCKLLSNILLCNYSKGRFSKHSISALLLLSLFSTHCPIPNSIMNGSIELNTATPHLLRLLDSFSLSMLTNESFNASMNGKKRTFQKNILSLNVGTTAMVKRI